MLIGREIKQIKLNSSICLIIHLLHPNRHLDPFKKFHFYVSKPHVYPLRNPFPSAKNSPPLNWAGCLNEIGFQNCKQRHPVSNPHYEMCPKSKANLPSPDELRNWGLPHQQGETNGTVFTVLTFPPYPSSWHTKLAMLVFPKRCDGQRLAGGKKNQPEVCKVKKVYLLPLKSKREKKYPNNLFI